MKNVKVNYFYFGLLFIAIATLHAFHVTLIEEGPFFSKCFFFIYAIAQAFLEVGGLVLLGCLVQRYLHPAFNSLFIIFSFLILLGHLFDFPLVRIMNISVWSTLDFIFQESLNNFLEMLYATHVSLHTWILGGMVTVSLFVLGMLFFYFTGRWTAKRPVVLFSSAAIKTSCGLFALFIFFDWGCARLNPMLSYLSFEKALPWKATLFSPSFERYFFSYPLRHWKEPAGQPALKLKKKPPIFLFVIESLREDYITEENAPTLYAFKKDNFSFPLAFSNANATQLSWFSIFHSLLPFHWEERRRSEHKGSLPLTLLKELGYKIHVYTSSRLFYYRMDEMIFGKKYQLVDDYFFFPHEGGEETCKSDRGAIHTLIEALPSIEDDNRGHLFIVFLESTHFDYSWPHENGEKFLPIIKEINYLKIACSKKDLGAIKNRYRNALYYVDSLFSEFFLALRSTPSWGESVIAITGDHGEEFFENGHIFHASDLNHFQTHTPLYYKFGNNRTFIPKTKLTSHIDIFPSIFHYLTEKEVAYFQGESIFKNKRWPYVVSGKYNASRNPYEFSIHNGKQRLLCRFCNQRDIFNCKEIKILNLKNTQEEILPLDRQEIDAEFSPAFEHLFKP